MKRFVILFLSVIAGTLTGPSNMVAAQTPDTTQKVSAEVGESEDADSESTTSVWMEKKLLHSQAILRALAMGDLDSVSYNASRLKVLNRVEGFVRTKNPEYRLHLNVFSRVIAEIERQAEQGNIEGATLAFNQLTVSCVQCHKTLRVENAASDSE